MFSKCKFLVKDGVLILLVNPHGVPVNSEYSQELCRTINDLGLCEYLSHFLFSEVCRSIRYIVPAKTFPALPLVRRTDFVAKCASMILSAAA